MQLFLYFIIAASAQLMVAGLPFTPSGRIAGRSQTHILKRGKGRELWDNALHKVGLGPKGLENLFSDGLKMRKPKSSSQKWKSGPKSERVTVFSDTPFADGGHEETKVKTPDQGKETDPLRNTIADGKDELLSQRQPRVAPDPTSQKLTSQGHEGKLDDNPQKPSPPSRYKRPPLTSMETEEFDKAQPPPRPVRLPKPESEQVRKQPSNLNVPQPNPSIDGSSGARKPRPRPIYLHEPLNLDPAAIEPQHPPNSAPELPRWRKGAVQLSGM